MSNYLDISIKLADASEKHVLRNMLELYFYDMSEFDDEDDRLELNAAGLYGYRWLDYYFNEDGRFAYLLWVNGNLAGFAMLRQLEAGHFEGAEFFVIRKYRKMGI